jgi:uncharacterized iron-regulated membrane protein
MKTNQPFHKNLYRQIWRWHFYAGLFCIPFIIFLASTGMIYLFKPQIDAIIDSPYDNLTINRPASAKEQINVAIAAVPGSILRAYELPLTPHSATRILVKNQADTFRVYVHPETLQALKLIREDDRFMRMIFQLHGELMLGDKGSMIVELVASWAIVILITGLYLWWPRDTKGLAGVLYPRLKSSKRIFWRDIHSVTGLWVSFFALFLLLSGLPWTKSWGGMLKQVRQIGAPSPVKQDWSTSHAEHMGSHHIDKNNLVLIDYSLIDKLISTVTPLNLAAPVLISPPSSGTGDWTARSDSQNRPLRTTLTLDGNSGEVISRNDFSSKPMMDRVIGTGVAAHEGQLFGWPNQLLGLLTALGLILMSVSSIIMWWRRKPTSSIGAPKPLAAPKFAPGIIAIIIALGTLLPLLGASIIFVTLLERFVLQRLPSARRFLDLGR